MPKMTAAEAAVRVLESEGVEHVFGIPGAAINCRSTPRCARTTHQALLSRHEEGASHTAEGYTRAAQAGKIGVCIGTSGPAGTDMITGLYSAMADSIPILCITGQAPRAQLHKEDFQAVDIDAIASPVTKWAVTVLRGRRRCRWCSARRSTSCAQAARARCSSTCRSTCRRGEIEYDPDVDVPLAVYKPRASRGRSRRRWRCSSPPSGR